MTNTIEEIKQAVEYSKILLDSINITGIENASKIFTVYNNLTVISKIIDSGELCLIKNDCENQIDEK